ncbi:hypothetical protein ACFMJX_27795, partial [Acinetobacter baumannii]
KRIVTPKQAMLDGSTHLVIGHLHYYPQDVFPE